MTYPIHQVERQIETPLTPESARQWIEGGRSQLERPAENNTKIVAISQTEYAVCLHRTDVVIVRPGEWELHSGGWQTVTTKDRINRYVPVRVIQRDFEWFVGPRNWYHRRDRDELVPFEDGMIVDRHGEIIHE